LYTTEALSDLIERVVKDKVDGCKIILIAHSLGCFMAGKLALKLGDSCLAMVLLGPKAQISEQEVRGRRILTSLPEFVFNIFRKLDRA
jgi:pimeloyl-ACP methyl ester carboxylesterase